MAVSMECHCIRSGELPHTTKLFADFLENFSSVAGFYAQPPTPEGIERSAAAASLDPAVRREVAEVLQEQNGRFGGDKATAGNLDRLRAGAVAVVTGQQVGLFSGPAYSFYKAITAIALARWLTERGTDAVPVFWLATEDHDLAEVNHSFWLDRRGLLERVELPSSGDVGRRVGEVKLAEGVTPALDRVLGMLEGGHREPVARTLRESYRAEETFGSAFGKLMARLLAGRGAILLDPLDSRLHRLAVPVFRRALEEHEALAKELVVRSKGLDRAGYHAQVRVNEPSTLLFFNVDGHRWPLRPRNSGFSAGRSVFTEQELLRALESAPEAFTPNVLLRPVVQDTLLPTAAYVGGPAEVAYFAQAEVVYRCLGRRMPTVVPRAGFTLVEPRVAGSLRRYGLDIRDVLHGRQHLRANMERQFLSRSLGKQFTAGEKNLRETLGKLRRSIGRLDRTLLGALDTTERKMLYQFLKLRGKAGRAENFRTGMLDQHERVLLDSLYPQRALQERSVCLVSFLPAHGLALLDTIESRAVKGTSVHQILYL
jgi:bacillithiol biosynthesis cysteine-adding enzyme BshC